MPFEISCECGQAMEVSEEWIGMEAECPACNKTIVIPDQNVADVTATEPDIAPLADAEEPLEIVEAAAGGDEYAPETGHGLSAKRDVHETSGLAAATADFTGGYYRHSGKVPITGIVIGVVTGLISAIVLGGVYGLLIYYIPFIYLNVILALGCGVGAGFATAFGLKLGKVRNNIITALASCFFGLLTNYVAWISWIFLLSERKAIIIDPVSMLITIYRLSDKNIWTIGSGTTPAFVFLIVWSLEVLLIAGAAVWAARSFLFHLPFCEMCDCWLDDKKIISPLSPMDSEAIFARELEAGNFSVLKGLNKLSGSQPQATKLELCHCHSCQDLYILTVKSVTTTYEDNKEQVNETAVVNNLLINGAIYQDLEQNWKVMANPVT